MNGWTIFFGLVAAYVLGLFWLVRSGRMEKWNLSLLLGFILMVRTDRGRGALAVTARPKRAWNLFGDLGVVVAYVGMALMTLLMLALVPRVLDPKSGLPALGASEILVIPGVNPFVPLWYGIAALIITLVVHEGGHGVMAIANKMRIKSVGLLFAIVPVGAFVEPDEDDLMESSRRERLRVYAAGPAVNFAVAGITLALFAGMVGAVAAIPGAPLVGITADSAAMDAGILPGDILTHANGTPLANWDALTTALGSTRPGQNLTFDRHDAESVNVTLGDRWGALTPPQQDAIWDDTPWGQAYCASRGIDEAGGVCVEALQQQSFLGVRPAQDIQGVLAEPFGNGGINFALYAALPLQEVRGDPYLSTYLPTFYTTPFDADWFWPIATLTFWVFWINLMVGLTNILPMLPLDGGHLFRDGMAGVFEKVRPKMDAEHRERLVGRLAGLVSFVILGAFLLQIFGPRFAQAFA